MTEPMSPDDFLEHYGVKGMKWGVRKARIAKLGGYSDKSKVTEQEQKTFKREVKAVKKGRGLRENTDIRTVGYETAVNKYGNKAITGRVTGDFRNSQGEKVSQDFANAVLAQAAKEKQHATYAKIGATYALAILGAYGSTRL